MLASEFEALANRCDDCGVLLRRNLSECPACAEVTNRIIKRWAEGDDVDFTNEEMAQELGISINALQKRLERLGFGGLQFRRGLWSYSFRRHKRNKRCEG